jgi:hypothetical protein
MNETETPLAMPLAERPMHLWAIECAKFGSEQEFRLLAAGWEPFSVVQEEDYCAGERYEVTVVYFRKQSIQDLQQTQLNGNPSPEGTCTKPQESTVDHRDGPTDSDCVAAGEQDGCGIKSRIIDPAPRDNVASKATNPEEHARGCEYDGATWKCASRCPVRAAMIAPTQTAEQYTQLLRELDDLLDFLAKEVITLDIVESDKNNGQWPRSDLVKHAREDIAKALQAPTDTERPKCPCGAWYWDEHTMACAIRVSAVATAPAVEKAKYRIRLLEDDNLLLRSRIAEACLHCSPGSVVWEILNPREESRPDRKGTE